jgi:tetratricopeptide (TPR) repeat protein
MTPHARERSRALARIAAIIALATMAWPAAARAQRPRDKKDTQEFTRQGLLITNFAPRDGADMKLARRAAEAVRSRVGKLVNKREVDVIDGDDIEMRMERSGYNADTVYDIHDVRAVGRYLRADEFVIASVANTPAGPQLSGHLLLFRDERLRQPLPPVTAKRLDSAAALFARSIAAARAQLAPERRCENALRDGSGSRAIAAAREGIAAFPQGAIARTCLVWALRQMPTPPATLLDEAQAILAIDSLNPHALEAAGTALDSLHRRDEAATHWLRLADTDTGNVDLAVRVGYALLDGGNTKRAEPFLTVLFERHPEDLRVLQQKWRAAFENKHWPVAISTGELLIARDSVARSDSSFYLKLGLAYHSQNLPFKAIETLAHGVATFPKDARLYSLYTQYIKAEADTVVPRGLALFPQSADLLALNAKELRARGKIAESLNATKQALALDTTMSQGQLMIAQLEIELGHPDSALVALHAALVHGEDSALVGQFALSKGNALYRAANGTKTSADFGASLRMLAFADSVRPSDQARFLTGAAALGTAQSALTEAAKLTDKATSCRLARMASDLLPMARAGLHAGETMFAEAAKQSLDYLDQLDPFAQQQLKTVCVDTAQPPPAGHSR